MFKKIRPSPYIEELLNNEDFKNIDINDIKIDDNDTDEKDETDGESIKSFNSQNEILLKPFLPYL